MNKKKIALLVAVFAFAGMSIGGHISNAKNNNIGYSFSVGYHQYPGFSASRYRETYNNKNCWKANMEYSEEGKNTVMNFWLAKNSTNVSDIVPLRQGGVTKYRYAYNEAARTNVRLKAVNNNYVIKSYKIAGYWDEETGVTKEQSRQE